MHKLTCVALGDMMHIWDLSTGPHSATGQLLRYRLTYVQITLEMCTAYLRMTYGYTE